MTIDEINIKIVQLKDELHDLVVSNDDADVISTLRRELGHLRELKGKLLSSKNEDTIP